MTPADHANTVRQALSWDFHAAPHDYHGNRLIPAERMDEFIGLSQDALAALDALQAKAETAEANERKIARLTKDLQDLQRANDGLRRQNQKLRRGDVEAERDAAVQAAEQARNALERCPLCTHEWRRHDPEDGKCDAPADGQYGACPCGREMAFHLVRNASLSKLALDATADGRIARAAIAGEDKPNELSRWIANAPLDADGPRLAGEDT